jgi:hypothetical protein
MDRTTRKVLTMYKMHRPRADIDTLHVNRRGGGRGMLQIEVIYRAEIINGAYI